MCKSHTGPRASSLAPKLENDKLRPRLPTLTYPHLADKQKKVRLKSKLLFVFTLQYRLYNLGGSAKTAEFKSTASISKCGDTSPRMPYLHLLTVQCERCANRVSAAAVFDIVTERKARCQHHKSCKRRKKHCFRCELFFSLPHQSISPFQHMNRTSPEFQQQRRARSSSPG